MDQKLKNEIEKKLGKMEANLENQEAVRLRWQFVDKFILCEVACKKVLTAYREDQKLEKPVYEKLHMKHIPDAMAWAGLDFTRDELNAMFYTRDKYRIRGTKSAKLLRDGAMHEHNEQDIQEIVSRFDELNRMMDAFLDKFSQVQTEQAPKKTRKGASKGSPPGKRNRRGPAGPLRIFDVSVFSFYIFRNCVGNGAAGEAAKSESAAVPRR